ncbi:extracellular solute-binding protein [Polaromonas sp. C04]|uniref:extracellular solute-binding protein n=1 Tax=Polaromonas sp. C04 TaxID=1945857 RepID=UPI000986C9FA|nr:extracellular solute-binding protein [Polaromonas sp. C04]OOG57463.1 ABC transporter substrate-binding protein [Polaromonas sp. C04]
MRGLLFCGLIWVCAPCWAAHAYAQFGDIKYPAGFDHFDYVNAQAPKGGEITLVPPTRLSNFDKYNPFTLKGSAPPGLNGLVFETLLTGTLDEPTTAYGLLAEDVSVAPDKLSVVFRLNPKARFDNGDPVLAADVKYSFDKITSKEAAPQFRTLFGEVKGATVLDARSVRFDFKRANAELPLIVGGLPVFSPKWGQGKSLDQIIADLPIGTGPYKIGKVNFGKDISYERDPNYWARDVNVRRGMFNFQRITYKIYQDNTAQLEAFKAGEFDYIQSFIAREWARAFTGRQFDSGRLIKKELRNGNAGDFQGFLFNTRRDKFKDVRVRQAIGLAMDFEWLNRQLFYNAYTRVRGYFVASDFEAKGMPGADELALLEPLRGKLPPEVFTQPVPLPPVTSLDPRSGMTLRDNLRRAKALLMEAGWTYRDGALRNAKGEAFSIEFLDNSGSMGRVVTPYAQNLEKLGIAVSYRVIDFAILQKRMDVFDFDIISNRVVGSEAPGSELLDRFGSKAADTEGSGNFIGVKSPAVDALLDKVTSSHTRPELIASVRALDRVLRFGHYVVPHWYSSVFRVAYRAGRFEQPAITPRYYQPDSWVTSVWWASAANLRDQP